MKYRSVKLLMGSVLFGGLLLFAFRVPLLDSFKRYRFEKSLESAELALEEGNFDEVSRMTGAAWRLGTGSLEQTRSLFRLASAVQSPDSLPLADELFSHSQAQLVDKVHVLEFVAEFGSPLLLDNLLGQLSELESRDSGVLALRIRRQLDEGSRLKALVLLDSLNEEERRRPSLQLLRCQLQAGERGNPLAWQSCRKVAVALMHDSEKFALPALRVLDELSDSELRKVAKPNLKEWVDSQNSAEPSDHLLAARWQLLQNPEQESEILSEVLTLKQEAPEEVARWLVGQGMNEMILEGNVDRDSAESFPFYLAQLQIYLDQRHWQKAADLLKQPHRSMVGSLKEGFQAVIASMQGDEVVRLTHLQEALRKARHSEKFVEYLALFQLGVSFGDRDLQRQSCEELVLLPSRFLPRGEKLTFLDQQFGEDPEFLASLYQKLAAAKPDDGVISYRRALLEFLVTKEREEPLRILNSLLVQYPEASSIRSAKALILAEKSPEEALLWLEGEQGDARYLEGAFETAVYANLLRATGKESQATHLERRLEWGVLPAYLSDFFEQQQQL